MDESSLPASLGRMTTFWGHTGTGPRRWKGPLPAHNRAFPRCAGLSVGPLLGPNLKSHAVCFATLTGLHGIKDASSDTRQDRPVTPTKSLKAPFWMRGFEETESSERFRPKAGSPGPSRRREYWTSGFLVLERGSPKGPGRPSPGYPRVCVFWSGNARAPSAIVDSGEATSRPVPTFRSHATWTGETEPCQV